MKPIYILFFIFCYVAEGRKVVPINKNANIDFINMEAGARPGGMPEAPRIPGVPVNKIPPAPNNQPTPAPQLTIVAPNKQPQVTTPKVIPTTKQAASQPPSPTPVTPKSVNPPVVSRPITTPGPGSVKQLVTFYDSQGKGSVIRPYSYSQAVKQG